MSFKSYLVNGCKQIARHGYGMNWSGRHHACFASVDKGGERKVKFCISEVLEKKISDECIEKYIDILTKSGWLDRAKRSGAYNSWVYSFAEKAGHYDFISLHLLRDIVEGSGRVWAFCEMVEKGISVEVAMAILCTEQFQIYGSHSMCYIGGKGIEYMVLARFFDEAKKKKSCDYNWSSISWASRKDGKPEASDIELDKFLAQFSPPAKPKKSEKDEDKDGSSQK